MYVTNCSHSNNSQLLNGAAYCNSDMKKHTAYEYSCASSLATTRPVALTYVGISNGSGLEGATCRRSV